MTEQDVPPAIDEAWELIEDGRPEEALGRIADLDVPERWPVEAAALLDLGRLDGAREALRHIEAQLGADTLDYAWTAGELALREWRITDAKALFETCREAENAPAVLDRLSLIAELEGDEALADRLLEEVAASHPDSPALPPRLSTEAFEEQVHLAIEDLPEAYRRTLERAEVIVERVPSVELIDPSDPAETPPDLLGLFVGYSPLETEEDTTAELPPRIYLFQRNLERSALDHEVLREEIRITLYHELAHLLGFDEEGVEEMGLE